MGFSILLVDYKSIQTTLNYIELCERYLHSSEQKQYIIVDNTEEASGLKFVLSTYDTEMRTQVDGKDVYKFSYNEIIVYISATNNNGGYAKGNNFAAKISKELFPNNNYIVSNNDILFDEEYDLDVISDEILKNDIAVIGPNVINPDGSSINPFNRPDEKFILFALFLNSILPRKIEQRPNDEVYTFSGCFWIFNSKYFALAGGFDERTFLYFEEQIMSERIRKVGGKFKYQDDFNVIHNHVNHIMHPTKAIRMLKYFYESMSVYAKYYLGSSAYKLFLSKVLFSIIGCVFYVERAILFCLKGEK